MAAPWLCFWLVSASVWTLRYSLWFRIAVLLFVKTLTCGGDFSFFWGWDYQLVLHGRVFIVCCWCLLWNDRYTILPVVCCVCCDLLIIWVCFSRRIVCTSMWISNFGFGGAPIAGSCFAFVALFADNRTCCFDTYIYDVVPNVLCATSLAR